MKVDLKLFCAAFFEEAEEHVANMENGLLALEEHPTDLESLNGIFRAAHSIKGGSGTFGFPDVARFTHAMESVLDRMRDGSLAATPDSATLLLRSTDFLKGLIVAAQQERQAPPETDTLIAELNALLTPRDIDAHAVRSSHVVNPPQTPAVDEATPPGFLVLFAPFTEFFLQGNDPVYLLRDLAGVGHFRKIEVHSASLPSLDALDPQHCYLSWSVEVLTTKSREDISEIFAWVDDISDLAITPLTQSTQPIVDAASVAQLDDATHRPTPIPATAPVAGDPLAAPAAAAQHAETSSIRVATEKVDRIINLVGELVIAQSMIVQAMNTESDNTMELLRIAIGEMTRNTRELQERVMAVRMLPMAHVFSRFPRMVRDLAGGLGKKVVLKMEGEDIEVDKGIIERIGDPLTHLVRNAIDHGIETVDERRRAGKSEIGTITMCARHEGGGLLVEVRDDGRGLDLVKIREKAERVGLLRQGDDVSDHQLRCMIFEPGFSTADKVTDLSGRGVGMDVVKRNVEALNGNLSVTGEQGKGAHIRLKLPLTLAVIDGLLLRVGQETYVLPLVAIIESLALRQGAIRSVVGHGDVVEVRGEIIPVVRLHKLFGDPRPLEAPRGLLVISENAGTKVALLVDELAGQAQVVIKSLEQNFRKVEGMMGATIMGDGTVAMILDIAGLVQLARSSAKRSLRTELRPIAAA